MGKFIQRILRQHIFLFALHRQETKQSKGQGVNLQTALLPSCRSQSILGHAVENYQRQLEHSGLFGKETVETCSHLACSPKTYSKGQRARHKAEQQKMPASDHRTWMWLISTWASRLPSTWVQYGEMTRSFPPGVGVRQLLWGGKLVLTYQTYHDNDMLPQWTKLVPISPRTKRNIKIPFVSFKTASCLKPHLQCQFLKPVCVWQWCTKGLPVCHHGREACLRPSGEGLSSATTHLKPFQVPGKLGLLRLLHVQLLQQVFWGPAVFPFLGLFVWSHGGRSSQSLQRSVQHTQLWKGKGQD